MARINEPKTNADLRDAAAEVKENLRDIGNQVREKAGESFEQMRDQASEYYEEGRRRAMEMEQTLEEYVREKPVQSILIAAGVGMLLGLLWKRR